MEHTHTHTFVGAGADDDDGDGDGDRSVLHRTPSAAHRFSGRQMVDAGCVCVCVYVHALVPVLILDVVWRHR